MHVRTTAEFEWDRRGVMRSARSKASDVSCGTYDMRASNMYV